MTGALPSQGVGVLYPLAPASGQPVTLRVHYFTLLRRVPVRGWLWLSRESRLTLPTGALRFASKFACRSVTSAPVLHVRYLNNMMHTSGRTPNAQEGRCMIHVLIRSGFFGLLPLGSHGSYTTIAMALRAKEQPRRTLAHTPKPLSRPPRLRRPFSPSILTCLRCDPTPA